MTCDCWGPSCACFWFSMVRSLDDFERALASPWSHPSHAHRSCYDVSMRLLIPRFSWWHQNLEVEELQFQLQPYIIVMMMGHNTPKHIEVNKLLQSKYKFSWFAQNLLCKVDAQLHTTPCTCPKVPYTKDASTFLPSKKPHRTSECSNPILI